MYPGAGLGRGLEIAQSEPGVALQKMQDRRLWGRVLGQLLAGGEAEQDYLDLVAGKNRAADDAVGRDLRQMRQQIVSVVEATCLGVSLMKTA